MHRSRSHKAGAASPAASAAVRAAVSATGLRELADLVRQALGRQPAYAHGPVYAVADGAADPSHLDKPSRVVMASDAMTVRAGRRHAQDRKPAGGDDRDDAGEPSVEAEHAEVWALVRAAQDGDGDAFGQLYDRYVDTVYRYVYFRLGDRTLAEDFTSETFLRALRRIGGITYQGRDIGAWFVTIARNIVLDHLKSARHRLEVTTADLLDGDDANPGPESAVLDLLTAERLMAAVKRLGEEQRECVVLRFVQGLSVGETAEVMGKNAGAIKALQHRAVRKLADLVGAELR